MLGLFLGFRKMQEIKRIGRGGASELNSGLESVHLTLKETLQVLAMNTSQGRYCLS